MTPSQLVIGARRSPNGAMYSEHIGQADASCDFDFLAAAGRAAEPEVH